MTYLIFYTGQILVCPVYFYNVPAIKAITFIEISRDFPRTAIGAFDKRTIIELSSDVIKEITQKYEYVQKGIGDMIQQTE